MSTTLPPTPADGFPVPSPEPGGGSSPEPPAGPRRSWRDRVPWAAAGVAAGAAGLGAAELVAALTGPTSSPIVAVAQAFIDLTPPWLKEAAIAAFGTHDKQVLLGGAALVVTLLAAGGGLLARRRPTPAAYLVLGLGTVAALAAATRPDAGVLAVAPSLVAALTGVVLLLRLARRAGEAGARAGRSGGERSGLPDRYGSSSAGGTVADAERRALLAASGVTAAAGLVAVAGGRALGTSARGADASRAAVRLPAPASPAPALPAGVEVGVRGVVPFRVPNAEFYRIDTATVVPRLRAADWRLRIHGMVEREVTIDYATLLAGRLVERDVTLICVSNEVGGDLVGNARWLGLPVGPLLAQAAPATDADMVLSTSADGWTASTPLDVLTDGRDALLAVGMNGDPLPVEHGFPVRLVVPGLYGYVSATKWVTELEVTRFDRKQAYWTPRGWSARGPVKTQSRIDVPHDGTALRRGRVAVAGVAWAQHRGIRGVEVRVDGGAWQPARLGAEASVDTWREWVFAWDATPGRHTLTVRATDGTGAVQTEAQAPPPPDGATGWHSITVEVS